ncbi:ABC transporter ATP-binding protein [Bradyrhizobium uaiense]|uniref:ABC transporter ATP-binding protein n=1 Tax=Bradyrhizobium uaiense TaxID=2594946 RepID=A0A6P1BPQ5_9BRAD|nr:ABC transporter ATP-binding protein [Bradyrhizobium uaiense]NEU99592.1 ABC transporter ATP-binding protein [Bradyrhizobium uaiense]
MNALPRAALADSAGLEFRGATKSYGGKRALNDISIFVPRGSFTVILGAAGAGKTTMLRSIAGLEKLDAGELLIGGEPANHLEPKDRDVAMIFDNLALYPNKTGFENIAHPLRVSGRERTAIETAVQGIASKLKCVHVLGRLPRTMSGGERQRVALGRALVREPRLFLLDEPLSSLDAMLRIELRTELRRLQREFGYTFVMATPDYTEAMAVADSIAFLREGEIIQIAEPQTLYDEPADWDVARFIGEPEINLLPASYSPDEGGRVMLGDGIVCQAPPALRQGGYRTSFQFMAGIRPEHLRLGTPELSAWCGEVTDIEPLGTKAAITTALPRSEVRILVAATVARDLKVGQFTSISFDQDKLIAFDRTTKARLL